MNEIVNKFLLVGDKFMPELHLKQPGFNYNACGPFTRNKERNELDEACFQYDIAYGKSKDLVKGAQSDKALKLQVIQNMMVIKVLK